MAKRLFSLAIMSILTLSAWADETSWTWNFTDNNTWTTAKIVTGSDVTLNTGATTPGTGEYGVTFNFVSDKASITSSGLGYLSDDLGNSTTVVESNYVSIEIPVGFQATFNFTSPASSGRAIYYTTDGSNTQTNISSNIIVYRNEGENPVTLKVWAKNPVKSSASQNIISSIVLEYLSNITYHRWTVNAIIKNTDTQIDTWTKDEIAEGSEFTAYLKKVIKYNEQYYELADDTYTGLFIQDTMNEDKVYSVNYQLSDDIVFFKEGEDITQSTVSETASGGAFCGYIGRPIAASAITIPNAGYYKAEALVMETRKSPILTFWNGTDNYSNNNSAAGITIGDGVAGLNYSDKFQVNSSTTYYLGGTAKEGENVGYNNSLAFDYILIRRLSTPTVTGLAAATPTYNGSAQNLVTTPTVTGGSIKYSTTQDGTYTEAIPQGTNVGDYSVWYKVTGDATHSDIAATQVPSVSITQATNTLSGTLSIDGWTYGSAANSPSGVTAAFGTVAYKYSNAENGEYGTYDAFVNGAVGTWWVKAYVDGTDNYTAVESNPVSFAISAATQTATITAEATQSTTYNGQAQPLTASVDKGTISITYYTNEARTEGEATEAPINAGTYYAIVSQSDVNYTSDPVYVTYTINKATLTATAADATRVVGEDNPAFTVNVTGFVNDETTGNAAGYEAPIATTTADTNSEAGTYPITVSGGAATNYNFTYVPGTLTVTAPISEEYVSTTKTWTFDDLTATTQYSTYTEIDGLYLRTNQTGRNFTVTAGASAKMTFADGYVVNNTNYLSVNNNATYSGDDALTATSTAGDATNKGRGMVAINASVAGTLYVKIKGGTSDKVIRVYFANGTSLVGGSGTSITSDGNIQEISYTSTGAGSFFVGGITTGTSEIYAVRFVPTSEAKAAWVYIESSGYTTFGNNTGKHLDLPEGLAAYSVKPGTSSATLTALEGIPNNAGVVLKGSPSTNFPLTESSSSYSASNNYMIRLTANSSINATEEVESSTRYNYILTEDAAEAKFAKANGSILAKDKAYFRSTKDLGDNIDLTIVSGASVETAPAAVATELTYSGEAQSLVTEGQATGGTLKYFVNTSGEAPTTSTDGWTNTVPTGTNAGTYYIWYYVAGDASHTSTAVTAIEGGSKTIGKKVPSVSDFDYSAPADLAYSGIAKEATVVAKSNITGIGTVTLKYYKGETETTPTDIGTYTVKITVAEGSNYTASASELSGESWTFTITAETSTYTITGVSEDEHGNKVEASPTSAAESATITLTITTAESYVLTSISVKDADNGDVELSGSDATRTFTMPAKNVVVSATWTANAVQQADTGDSKTQESYSITDANNAQVTTITATSGATSVTIPSSVNGVPVTSISDDAFENVADKSNIKSIDLSTTSITGVTVDRTSGVFNEFPEETMIYMPAGNTEASGQKNVIINGKCSNFVMTDTKSYKIPKDFKAESATISRTFTNGTYCTLCLPYTIPSDNLSGKVYEFSGVNDATVTMTESNNGLQANKPYIFVPNSSVNGMTISDNSIFINISMNDSPNTVNTEAQFTFKGVYENMDFSSADISNGVYGFAAEADYGASIGQFVKAANGASIKGMRAYLAYNGALNGTSTASTRGEGLPEYLNVVLIHANGSTTNIGKLELMTAEDGSPVYNLNGQRVDNSYKGLVIKNGKKVVKK